MVMQVAGNTARRQGSKLIWLVWLDAWSTVRIKVKVAVDLDVMDTVVDALQKAGLPLTVSVYNPTTGMPFESFRKQHLFHYCEGNEELWFSDPFNGLV
jgi:hypothetical protein